MRFTTAILAATVASLASAQAYFTNPVLPSNIAPGTNYALTWVNGQGASTVSLQLVNGPSGNLKVVSTIASEQPHNGTYTWTPSASLASGSYAFKIVDDSNPNNYNYSDMFNVVTSVTSSAAASASSTSSRATSSSAAAAATASSSTASSARSSSSSPLSASSSTAVAATTATSSGAAGTSSVTSSRTSTAASATGSNTPASVMNSATTLSAGGLLAVVAGIMMLL